LVVIIKLCVAIKKKKNNGEKWKIDQENLLLYFHIFPYSQVKVNVF
jgi:hypothetical protein